MSSWDAVPWMIGGGVEHSTNVARLLAYVAAEGQEGIIGTLDLEVRERAVPDGNVRIAPGACTILNRNPHVEYDAYAARLPIEDTVAIGATGSGGWRTDLVVARVMNPFLQDEPFAPPSAADIAAHNYQFVETYVIPSVLSGAGSGATHPTKAQVRAALGASSAIPLASVALPPSTGTVQQAHIKDWRQMAQFREAQRLFVTTPGGTVNLADATWKDIASVSVEVPDWATHYSARAILGGLTFSNPQSIGNLRILLGTLGGQTTNFNESVAAGSDRTTLMAGDADVPIPANQRGGSLTLKVQGQKTSGQTMVVNSASACSLDVVFQSKPEHNV